MLGFLKERRRHTLPQNAVPSAQAGLTSLFGMGRGEPRRNNHLKPLSSIEILVLGIETNLITQFSRLTTNKLTYWDKFRSIWFRKFPPTPCGVGKEVYISLRVISTTRLWHYCLYICSLSTWSSSTTLKRNLILWWVSRLYAFSAYPFPT